MKKTYKWLVFTIYPLILLTIFLYDRLLKDSEPARYAVATYLVFGYLYLFLSLLFDCLHRDFATKRTKSLWFIGLLTMSYVVIPVYLYKVVNRDKKK